MPGAAAAFFFFGFLTYNVPSAQFFPQPRIAGTHIVPCPHRPERIKESHILKQIRVQPQSWRNCHHGDTEQYQAEDTHEDEQSNETQHAHTQIPHAQTHHGWPQREHDETQQRDHHTHGGEHLCPCPRLVEEGIVQFFTDLLLRLDLHVPYALDSLLLLLRRRRLNLGYTQSEQAAREEGEGNSGGGGVGDFWEERVLASCGLVGGGLEGAECSLDCLALGVMVSCWCAVGWSGPKYL